MKICVFADIHGNGPAFSAAYDMIVSERADLNIFLGDLCGYYFDQVQIYEMMVSLPNLIAIRGNHDEMTLKVFKGDDALRREYLGKYGKSIEHLLSENCTELLQWLSGLPASRFFPSLGLSCFHGSPSNPMEGYVYPDSTLEEFSDDVASLFCLGHTHYPMARFINRKLIVNPGSLGQPRNSDWPTYAVINHASEKVAFRDVVYDKSELIRRIDQFDAGNQYLRNVLFR